MSEDRRYTRDGCECGDPWCAGCDDPQTEADLAASNRDTLVDDDRPGDPFMGREGDWR